MLLALVLAPAISLAHGGLLSQGEYRFEESEVRARLVFATVELATSLKGADGDADEDLSAAELATEATRAALLRLLGRVSVAAPEGPCAPRLESARLVEGSGVELDASWRCPPGSREAAIDVLFLSDFDAGHRHLVTMLGTTSSDVSIAVAGNARFPVSGTAAASGARFAFPALEWKHGLFVVALVLAVASFLVGRVRRRP